MTNTKMMKRAAAVLTGVFVATVAVWAARSVTATATISNYNGLTPYSLQSDGSNSATYSGDFTPTAGSGTDYFQLNLDLSKSRSVVLTLNPLDSNSAAAAPFKGPLALPGAILISRCFTPSNGYQDWTQIQPATPDGNCAMRVNFTYEHESYTLVMSPEFPGTGTGTVTCTNWSASSKSCVAWTDVPNSSAANANVAYLYNTTSGPATNGQPPVGSYSMTFSMTVTNP